MYYIYTLDRQAVAYRMSLFTLGWGRRLKKCMY